MKKIEVQPVARLTHLLGAPVFDRHRLMGHVIDLRLAADPHSAEPALAVKALIMDTHRTGSLLGYERREQQGPWLIRVILRAVHRRAALIDWTDVEEITTEDTGHLRLGLRAGYTARSPQQ
jgi:hypothetical protein